MEDDNGSNAILYKIKLGAVVVVAILVLALLSRQCKSPSTTVASKDAFIGRVGKYCESLLQRAQNESLPKLVRLRYMERGLGAEGILKRVCKSGIVEVTPDQKKRIHKISSEFTKLKRRLIVR